MSNIKAIESKIKSIATRSTKLDNDIQEAAVLVIEHIHEHKEASLACKLFNALGKGHRRNALAEFLLTFGDVKVSRKKDKEAIPFLYEANLAYDLEGAKVTPWHSFKIEKPISEEFDLEQAINSLTKRLTKAINEGKDIKGGDDLIAKVRALTAELGV